MLRRARQLESGQRLLLGTGAALFLIIALGILVRPLVHTKPAISASPPTNDQQIPATPIQTDAPDQHVSINAPQPPPEDANHILHLNHAHEWPEHNVIHSASLNPSGTYIALQFGEYDAYNPNIIPHPYRNETYIMLAHAGESDFHLPDDPDMGAGAIHATELYCDAKYDKTENKLKCVKSPLALPISPTSSEKCTGDLEFFNFLVGPGEVRVFVGPGEVPYTMFILSGTVTCMGMWMQDLRRLVRWPGMGAIEKEGAFKDKTELRRPAGEEYNAIEKNWFVFWDAEGGMYLHYTLTPNRSFAKVDSDGEGVGEDLAPQAYDHDNACLAKRIPTLKPGEKIHQATNSLSITLCPRSQPDCGGGTYIMTIFHHKMFYGAHNQYEPYVMLFENTPPFKVYGVSERPFWISGRGMPEEGGKGSEMMYMTTINWRERGRGYHGYLDDEIWLGFGIEDQRGAGIDVKAEELVRDMGRCE